MPHDARLPDRAKTTSAPCETSDRLSHSVPGDWSAVTFFFDHDEGARRPAAVKAPGRDRGAADVLATTDKNGWNMANPVEPIDDCATFGHKSVFGPVMRDESGKVDRVTIVVMLAKLRRGWLERLMCGLPVHPGACGPTAILPVCVCQSSCICVHRAFPIRASRSTVEIVPCLGKKPSDTFGDPINLGSAGRRHRPQHQRAHPDRVLLRIGER